MIKEMIVEGKIIVNQSKSSQSLRMIEKIQNLTMSKRNITKINTRKKTINIPGKTKLMTEQKTRTEVNQEIMTEEMTEKITEEMTEKITENNTEGMNLKTEIKKDQEANPKFNLKNKTDIKANKKEDTTKIIVSNLKEKIITSRRVSILNLKSLKIMFMLVEKLTLINFMTKSRLKFPNTTLLE